MGGAIPPNSPSSSVGDSGRSSGSLRSSFSSSSSLSTSSIGSIASKTELVGQEVLKKTPENASLTLTSSTSKLTEMIEEFKASEERYLEILTSISKRKAIKIGENTEVVDNFKTDLGSIISLSQAISNNPQNDLGSILIPVESWTF